MTLLLYYSDDCYDCNELAYFLQWVYYRLDDVQRDYFWTVYYEVMGNKC